MSVRGYKDEQGQFANVVKAVKVSFKKINRQAASKGNSQFNTKCSIVKTLLLSRPKKPPSAHIWFITYLLTRVCGFIEQFRALVRA
jgi:DNA-binding phage protein